MPRVEVNWNFHKHCLAMRETKPKARKKHRKRILLMDAQFAVQPAGYKKAVESGVRNVHAYVRGHLMQNAENEKLIETLKKSGRMVRYNPFRSDTFHDSLLDPVHESKYAYLEDNTIYVG